MYSRMSDFQAVFLEMQYFSSCPKQAKDLSNVKKCRTVKSQKALLKSDHINTVLTKMFKRFTEVNIQNIISHIT